MRSVLSLLARTECVNGFLVTTFIIIGKAPVADFEVFTEMRLRWPRNPVRGRAAHGYLHANRVEHALVRGQRSREARNIHRRLAARGTVRDAYPLSTRPSLVLAAR